MKRYQELAADPLTRPDILGLAILLVTIFGGCDRSYPSNSPADGRIDNGEGLMLVTDDTFSREVLEQADPVVVVMTTKWCPKCTEAKPVLHDLSFQFRESVRFREVDAESNRFLSEKYNVTQYPTILIFADGEVQHRIVGDHHTSRLEHALNTLMANAARE
ncbi:thioredoxin [Bremerella cremea]|uniref:Thioredoxin n=1 Tax=Bremerella cremea TaxID=1031537 RepID=A0A368KLH1_9BACT|nr:thioredoxin family protein [Bremerella cremea]RCS42037.1 thioredoxin [Bremerella cremea]